MFKVNSEPCFIYHAELGIDPQNEDFAWRPIEWLYTGRARSEQQDTQSETPESRNNGGHSTCTASKAAGSIYGASKTATLVVVKMLSLTYADITGVLSTIFDDIDAKGREKQSVISISWGDIYPTTFPLRRHWEFFKDFAVELNRRGVPIFVAAGNYAERIYQRNVNRAPAVLASWYPQELRRLVVVGSCNNYGIRSHFSQQATPQVGTIIQVHAPGEGI